MPKVLVDKENLGFWSEFLVRREMDGCELKDIISWPVLFTLPAIPVVNTGKTRAAVTKLVVIALTFRSWTKRSLFEAPVRLIPTHWTGPVRPP